MSIKLFNYINEKNFDLIYENYGKLAYSFFTPKKYKEKDIEKLMQEEQYEKIECKYFSYPKEVTRLGKKDFAKLNKEHKYFQQQEKYSGLNYLHVISNDYKYETGKRLTIPKALKYKIIRKSHVITISYVSSLALLLGAFTYADLKTSKYPLLLMPAKYIFNCNNKIIYYQDVKEYDENLKDYASQFNLDEMTDEEIIVKVMEDIRSNTYYGHREETKYYGVYFRLELDENNNIGVCRHMADKFTTIMNLINPDYQATNMIVNLNTNIDVNKCDIYGKEQTGNVISDNLEYYEYNVSEVGNHLVTLLKPREGNYYLVVDVTNPSIGILENGKIHMFNNDSTESMKYVPYGQAFVFEDSSFIDINRKMLSSYLTKFNFDELEKQYGLDAQNEIIKTLN